MRFTQLNDEITADTHFRESGLRDPESAVAAEISVRLLELRELIGPTHAAQFITRLAAVWSVSQDGFWLVIRIMTGDVGQITLSHTALGAEDAKTKQASQQAEERALAAIKRNFPHVCDAIVSLKAIHAKIEDQQL